MFNRILMNQADASPGNGAPASPPAVPPAQEAPPANGAPAPNPLEQTVANLATLVEGLAKSVNSLHASDRRAREGKQPAAKPDDSAGTNPTADDPSSLLALRDAFDDSTAEMKLTKGQRQLLREHVMGKRPHPSDVDGYVTDYVARAGWAAAPQNHAAPVAAQPAALAPKPQQNAQPVSDRGSPPPSQVPLHEADLVTMSESDRAHLLKEKGPVWYRAQLAKQLQGRRLLLRQ